MRLGEERGVLFPSREGAGEWVYHDEEWVRVLGRFEHRQLLQEGRALVVRDNHQKPTGEVVLGSDGSVEADVAARTQQEWVWLHLDPAEHSWRDVRWEFTVRRDTNFRELQFGFRYVDFYNRYRFRHEDGHLHFDIVVNGRFENSVTRVPFEMTLGRDYRWVIGVQDNRFVLWIDDELLMDEVDGRRLFPRGSIAVILWENDGQTPIRASVREMRVIELAPEEGSREAGGR